MNVAVYKATSSSGYIICRFIRGRVRCVLLSPRKQSEIPGDLLDNEAGQETTSMYVQYHFDGHRLQFEAEINREYCWCNGTLNTLENDGSIWLRITRKRDKVIIDNVHLKRVGSYRINKNRDRVYPPPGNSAAGKPAALTGTPGPPATPPVISYSSVPAGKPAREMTGGRKNTSATGRSTPEPTTLPGLHEQNPPVMTSLSDRAIKLMLCLITGLLFMGCATCFCGSRTGCRCNDGTTSEATGTGACSHHGGVKYWYYKRWWDKK